MFAHVGWSSGAAQALEVHRIYFSDLHCICSGSQCLCLPPPFLLLALKWHSSPFIPDNSWTSQLLLERSSGWMLWNLLMQTDPLKQLCGCLHLEKALASGESPSFWRKPFSQVLESWGPALHVVFTRELWRVTYNSCFLWDHSPSPSNQWPFFFRFPMACRDRYFRPKYQGSSFIHFGWAFQFLADLGFSKTEECLD